MGAYKILGTSDDVTQCDCCGRSDLKATVGLETEGGCVVHFGTVCAAKAMRIPAADVRKGTANADRARKEAERAAADAAWRAEDARFQAWLDVAAGALRDFGGRPDRFAQLNALGGMVAARAAYTAAA